ncbi:MAG: Hsp70 family protein [Pirellulaceae bacterium]
MELILGIDLGTTNSVVSVVQDGKPVVLGDGRQEVILPSLVGVDSSGGLLVGEAARNQALLAPERTVKSIKRRMGEDVKVPLGEASYSPQEVSAMILRTLKDRAEQSLGRTVDKAVITVPAFFTENQRRATREAGQLAGLDVVRIVNEPTAAALTYEPHPTRRETLVVYDLGGGTFDVSLVQIESGVIEVLASHGDTHLGGDDFDQLLLDLVAEQFLDETGVDLRTIPAARSRLLQAVEDAKKRLSFEPYTEIAEEFIAEKDGQPLHLRRAIERKDYEALIDPLLRKTLTCVDSALEDAKLTARDIDRVILVGGSTRTPLVHQLLRQQLHHDLHLEVDPDLCVSMGAAVQGALVAGVDVGAVLVDITPHTLGIECLGEVRGRPSRYCFSSIIERNTPLPAVRSEIYYTEYDGQNVVDIRVLQGESDDARYNQPVGQLRLDGLNEDAPAGNEVLVRFELDLDGILTVAVVERDTGLRKEVTIENAITRFRAGSRDEAKAKLESVFGASSGEQESRETAAVGEGGAAAAFPQAEQMLTKSKRLLAQAAAEDAEEMRSLIEQLGRAVEQRSEQEVQRICDQLEDLMFYLEDA